MPIEPDVSIIVPVHNDVDYIEAALDSCLTQSWDNVEIICVDDASTDATSEIIERYRKNDSRVHLLRQDRNRSAFQARRVGIMSAKAPYILFLDGDDELAPDAVETTLTLARAENADVVGFGVDVVGPDGQTGGKFERTLQPTQRSLKRDAIISKLFPVGATAQGHIWKYLWDISLLKSAYSELPEDLELYRANDLPVSFLALAHADRYVSTPERLLRYYWRRGASGHVIEDRASFEFYLAGLVSVGVMEPGVEKLVRELPEEGAEKLRAAYESARLSIVANLLRYWVDIESFQLREECLDVLCARVGAVDVIRSSATFFSGALPLLVQHREVFAASTERPVRNILLTATDLSSGGAQGVVVSQARHLVEGGFRVVIGLRSEPESVYDLPPGVELVQIWGATQAERIERYLSVCREFEIDVAVDHWVLYRDDWPFVALAAGTLGVRTIGWIHNFALRPIFDSNRRISFLTSYLQLLWRVVVLSEVDVAFWKLRGIEQVVYLPNPPSPLLLERSPDRIARELKGAPIRLAWWGRLQQSTKRLRDLVEVAAMLRTFGVDFRLTIIGPDSRELTAEKLLGMARDRGIEDAVFVPGPMHGDALQAELEEADLFVYTSAIEGYPLTLVEAQSLGLPVAMYELPWLATVQNNSGIVTAPQFDVRGLASKIAAIARNPARYRELSMASLEAARTVLSHDFTQLYSELLADSIPDEFSPQPSIEHTRILLDRAVAFSEQQIRSARRREDQQKARVGDLERRNVSLFHKVEGLTQGIGELHRVNHDLGSSNDRLVRENEKLIGRFEKLADRARRQRSRVVELTQWRVDGQEREEALALRITELEARLEELARKSSDRPRQN